MLVDATGLYPVPITVIHHSSAGKSNRQTKIENRTLAFVSRQKQPADEKPWTMAWIPVEQYPFKNPGKSESET